jgi:hypothetical protein
MTTRSTAACGAPVAVTCRTVRSLKHRQNEIRRSNGRGGNEDGSDYGGSSSGEDVVGSRGPGRSGSLQDVAGVVGGLSDGESTSKIQEAENLPRRDFAKNGEGDNWPRYRHASGDAVLSTSSVGRNATLADTPRTLYEKLYQEKVKTSDIVAYD